MIGYATVGTNDLERARAFYDALLAPMGATRLFSIDRGSLYATGGGEPMLGVLTPADGGRATPGNGSMAGIVVDGPAEVDRVHAHAVALGGSDAGAPGYRPGEGSPFYAAYFRDPEGNKLAVYNWKR